MSTSEVQEEKGEWYICRQTVWECLVFWPRSIDTYDSWKTTAFHISVFCPFPVEIEDESTVLIQGQGTITIRVLSNGLKGHCQRRKVTILPALKYSSISTSVLVRNGMKVAYSFDAVQIEDGNIFAFRERRWTMFTQKTTPIVEVPHNAFLADSNIYHAVWDTSIQKISWRGPNLMQLKALNSWQNPPKRSVVLVQLEK